MSQIFNEPFDPRSQCKQAVATLVIIGSTCLLSKLGPNASKIVSKINKVLSDYFILSIISWYFSLDIPSVLRFEKITVIDNSLCSGTTIDLGKSFLL